MKRPLLLLTPDFPPAVGGIQHLLGEVAEHLTDDWDVTVCAPADHSAGASTQTPVRVLRTRSSWGGRKSALVLAEMAAIAARRRAALHVAGHLICVPSALAGGPGVPIALWAYGSELWSPAGRALLPRTAPRIRRLLAISSYTAAQAALGGVDPTRIRICPPGLDPLRERPAAGDRARLGGFGLLDAGGSVRPYIVTVARMAEPHKGHELLVQTWPALHARHPEARCVIVGTGPLGDRFRRASEAAGAAEAVCWLGRLGERDKQLVLSEARALVMASTIEPAAAQFEGYGLTYLEAAQLGRPSVAANAAGPADVVEHGVTGLLVEPGDQVSLLEAVDRLLSDAELADRLGRTAQRHVELDATWTARMPAIRAALAEAVA